LKVTEKKGERENGKKENEKKKERDKCEVTVHAEGTRGTVPLVL
jgi:hypothetical protein